jgi:3-phosphoshikimate 1-carboxyvinyltransferase
LINKFLNKKSTTPLAEVTVPYSKSIANRLLILNALLKSELAIKNMSQSDDTVILQKVLSKTFNCTIVDVKNAGTCYRFLTAYFALTADEVILKGSEEMNKRPIKILVDALRQLGAEINYLGTEGYPPLRIVGTKLTGGNLQIDGGVSSQYISALLLIAPFLKQPLTIEVVGEFKSQSYVMMTVSLLKQLGVVVSAESNTITVTPLTDFKPNQMEVEADWSSASYWFEYVSFLPLGASMHVKGLKPNSIQGDAVVIDLYAHFGITTEFVSEGIILTKTKQTKKSEFKHSFNSTPDIVQTLALTCVGEGINGVFDGVSHLKHKETDRLLALKHQLTKLNYVLTELTPDSFKIEKQGDLPQKASIKTYQDHRMAMAFAPLVLKMDTLEIEDPQVVQKSYPGFWDHF